MAKLVDTTEWREFRVADLFDKCELKWRGNHEFNKALDVSDAPDDEFNLPLVNAKLGGNGIMFYGRESEWDSVKMSIDIVSNGASAVGSVYAQPQETGVLWDAYLVKCRDDIGTGTLQFLATVMESQIKQHFSYDNKCTWNKVKLLSINLPVTPDGKPDWDYMEQYMKRVMDEMRPVAEELHQLESTLSLHPLDVSNWKEFKVGDLFVVETTKSIDKRGLDFNDNYEYAYVMRTSKNEGVEGYIESLDYEPNAAGTLSVVQIGEKCCLYRDTPWYATQNIFKLTPLNTSDKEALRFASCVISKQLNHDFGEDTYSSYPTKNTLAGMNITLPATFDGKPDWDAMAERMRGYTDSVREVAEVLHELE